MMMRMLFVMMDSDGDGTVSLQEFEVLVTKFLRDALTVEALGVPKLEAMARAAGLLGEGQRITQAKLFRQRSQSEQQSDKTASETDKNVEPGGSEGKGENNGGYHLFD